MASRNHSKKSSSSRLWPVAGLLAVTAAFLFLVKPDGLEHWFYDAFQRYQNNAPHDDIVLVTIDSRQPEQQELWSDRQFGKLLARINAQQPRMVIATQPLTLPAAPGEEQLRALNKLQRTAARSESLSNANETLSVQLARYQQMYDQRKDLAQRIAADSNVLLATLPSEFAIENNRASNCSNHAINLNAADDKSLRKVTKSRYLAIPPSDICQSAAGVGFAKFWPDTDGVIRHASLVLSSEGIYLPSLALSAIALNNGQANSSLVVASPTAVTLDDKIINTGDGFRILNRYYSATTDAAFRTLSAASLLKGTADSQALQDKIVLLGENDQDAFNTLSTPVSPAMSPLTMVATNLSNLLDGSYLLRPAWLGTAETIGLFAVVALLALTLPALSLITAFLLSVVIAALFGTAEAWLLMTASIWVHLASYALLSIVTVWTIYGWTLVTNPGRAAPARAGENNRRAPQRQRSFSQSEMDLEFSLLRQQAPTDETKEKVYDLGCINMRHKEFARAERIFAHIHEMDPGYRDVRERLDELGSARKKPTPKRKAAKLNDGPDRRTLGRYEIDRVLGKGAMATVYLGRDPKINRKVAIKTIALAKEFDAGQLEDARTQFRREAESAGRLNHPNIIAIYDAGEDEEISYLAMEYFEGDSLVNHVKADNLLPAKWVLELGARAAEALDYAHRQNVVHRDVKPANLLYHAATDSLKLTDFGIARLTDSSRTKTGVILGTPSYMAPEQLTASGVTGQSDLYSLGVTMYQLIAGRAPFQADSIPKLMDKIMHDDHTPLCELRDDIPASVDAVINKAMAKNPADRFPNGRAMAMTLRDCAKTFEN